MSSTLQQLLSSIESNKNRLVAAIVHFNDTYIVEERKGAKLPGMPKVISTVKRIREHVRSSTGRDKTLVVHSGDFLGPSRLAQRDQGQAMVELLNRAGVSLCVLGNHEFDHGEERLAERIREAKFGIVSSNVETDVVPTIRVALWPDRSDALIAIAGIVSPDVHRAFGERWAFVDGHKALEAIAKETEQVPYHVVLSHANRMEDRELRRGLPSWRWYILGGHDHDIDWPENDGLPLYKNRANCETLRIILLLAGGGGVLSSLVRQCDRLQEERIGLAKLATLELLKERIASSTPRYPDDVEALLASLHSVDAAPIRSALAKVGAATGVPLVSAIYKIPNLQDDRSFVLRFDDHSDESAEDKEYVAALVFDGARGQELVVDLSAKVRQLDLRDETLRYAKSGFAALCAECVRKAASAEVCLLNAGSFRVDAILSPIVRLSDLYDIFLYDRADSVIVLELPRSALEQLILHGKTRLGQGGFSHISPELLPQAPQIKCAIVSYLVESPRSIDGYQVALAESLGLGGPSALQSYIQGHISARLSIIDSICSYAQHLPYCEYPVDEDHGWERAFIERADVFLSVLGIEIHPPEGFPLARVERAMQEKTGNPKREASRDALVSAIRELPAVHRYEELRAEWLRSPNSGEVPSELVNAVIESKRVMQGVYDSLMAHPYTFRNRIPYEKLFEYAAEGIGGWIN